jgi:CRISPR system Cascade subunit CasD
MATLLLRLAGPMQSWGTRSRFDDRDTERFPSKSGVIGLLCAALGRPRSAPVDDLAALRMGVRADRPGVLSTDFHTAMRVAKASGASPATVVSRRHYLADAAFLVGLEGDPSALGALADALQHPVWPLCLGRKSFPPGAPLLVPDGLRPVELESALKEYPWLESVPAQRRRPPETLPVQWECGPGEDGEPRQDVPVSFADRLFSVRRVRHDRVPCPPALEDNDVPQ